MRVGIPREIKDNEYRVAITPAGVHELVDAGHTVFLEKDAGVGSSIPDDDFVAAGAKILGTADDVWGEADLVLKVKEPIADEYHRMRSGQVGPPARGGAKVPAPRLLGPTRNAGVGVTTRWRSASPGKH